MEDWQLQALESILETDIKEVEAGERVYISSPSVGPSCYHLLSKVYDTIQIEQLETGEKWSKRVYFSADELPALMKTLLLWHFDEITRMREDEEREQTRKEQIAAGITPDPLADLDDHPF